MGGAYANIGRLMAILLDDEAFSAPVIKSAISAATLRLALVFPDRGERYYLVVRNGVLVAEPIAPPGKVDATITLPRSQLIAALFLGSPLTGIAAEGDPQALPRLIGWLDTFKPSFPIVTRPSGN